MELLTTQVNAERFDELVHGTEAEPVLPQHGGTAMEVAAKPNGMKSGAAAVVISFCAVTPDGRVHRVQAVTSRKLLLAAAKIIENHPDLRRG